MYTKTQVDDMIAKGLTPFRHDNETTIRDRRQTWHSQKQK